MLLIQALDTDSEFNDAAVIHLPPEPWPKAAETLSEPLFFFFSATAAECIVKPREGVGGGI